MQEAQPVKGFGIVDGCEDNGGPGILQMVADLVPQLDQQVSHATSFNSSKLVSFAGYLSTQPVEDKALIKFRGQHRAGDIPEVSQAYGAPALWNYRQEFLLPDLWPHMRSRDLVLDTGERDGEESGKPIHQGREDVTLHHGLWLLKRFYPPLHLVGQKDRQFPVVSPGYI